MIIISFGNLYISAIIIYFQQEAEDKEKKVLEDKCILEKLIQGLETEVQEVCY